MSYKHLMIDIETLGTKSNSVVLSIAAVNFDLESGASGQIFNRRIDIQSCLDFGLEIDGKTLQWWLNNVPSRICVDAFAGTTPLANALVDFFAYCKNLKQDDLEVWGNSARFDLGLIEDAATKACMLLPWKYWNERDVRTLVSFAPHVKKETEFIGDKHNPIYDCFHQIEYCSKIWNLLKPLQ